MSTTITNKFRPLEIVIGAVCAIWAVWCMFITILFFDSTGPFFSNYMELDGIIGDMIRALMKVFTYASHIVNPLLLLWFLLKRKELGNGAATLAIIGLTTAIVLDIVNIIVFRVHPLDAQTAMSQTYLVFIYVFTALDWLALILIGTAFIVMSRRFDKKIGLWAIIVGTMLFIYVVIQILSLLNSYILINFYPITQYAKVTQIVNIVQELFIAIKYFAMCMFFLLPKTKKF